MLTVHGHANVELPIDLEMSIAILGVGLAIFFLVAIEMYRYET
ncbi:MAG: hypothetical protein ACI8XM_002208 [Haloarculaceae archaeon]|jgi:hypothetical protein